jgi:hypothetical protein
MIRFSCPKCGSRISVQDKLAGRPGRCKCGQALCVPKVGVLDSSSFRQGAVPAPTALPAPSHSSLPAARDISTATSSSGLFLLSALLLTSVLGSFLIVGLVWVLSSHKQADAAGQKLAQTPPTAEEPPPLNETPAPKTTKPASALSPEAAPRTAPTPEIPPKVQEKPAAGIEVKPEPVKEHPPQVQQPPQANFVLPLEALGSADRLEKLKTIRLKTRASFTTAKNINDITLTWCWEPKVTVRFEERNREEDIKRILSVVKRSGKSETAFFLDAAKKMQESLQMNAEEARRFETETRTLIKKRDYTPFFDSVVLIEEGEVHQVFNKRLALRVPAESGAKLRNLCLALSVSNLLPLKRQAFQIERGAEASVKGKPCVEYRVHGPRGTELKFYFDKQTELLTKISHPGHDPRAVGLAAGKVQWEHYFSDYRETDGLKQWRRLEIRLDGSHFSTLDVDQVEFFDRLLPEMRLPTPD